MNFSTLIATKAARVCTAAAGDQVLEFGLRRAQGIDGGITATRSSYIGGCHATSNVLGGKLFGIPVAGTHAHSWVMAFDTEIASFHAYADAMPNNCVFLVDTYDTIEGVRHAIEVGQHLHKQGRSFLGIRLDSGELGPLSKKSRKMLDDAGFPQAQIFASNELDENIIADLKASGAPIAVWGVGTNLVTGHPQSAIDGVYKLSAYRKKGEKDWKDRLKLSEKMAKVSDPGIMQVRRYFHPSGELRGDMMYDIRDTLPPATKMIDYGETRHSHHFEANTPYRDVLVPVFRQGKCVYTPPTLAESRAFAQKQLSLLPSNIKKLSKAAAYPLGLEESLHVKKHALVEAKRQCTRSS